MHRSVRAAALFRDGYVVALFVFKEQLDDLSYLPGGPNDVNVPLQTFHDARTIDGPQRKKLALSETHSSCKNKIMPWSSITSFTLMPHECVLRIAKA